jgi:hypothetical protein
MTSVTDIVIGVIIGIGATLVSSFTIQLFVGWQEHREARFSFYREKAEEILPYIATTNRVVRQLVRLGATIGAGGFGKTINIFAKQQEEPSENEIRSELQKLIDSAAAEYEQFMSKGTYLLLPKRVWDSIFEMNEQIGRVNSILQENVDLRVYVEGHQSLLSSLVQQLLQGGNEVLEVLRRELGLPRTRPL